MSPMSLLPQAFTPPPRLSRVSADTGEDAIIFVINFEKTCALFPRSLGWTHMKAHVRKIVHFNIVFLYDINNENKNACSVASMMSNKQTNIVHIRNDMVRW